MKPQRTESGQSTFGPHEVPIYSVKAFPNRERSRRSRCRAAARSRSYEASRKARDQLRSACIAGVAIAAKRPDLCDEAPHPSLRDSCFVMLVTQRGMDESLCARVKNSAPKSACAKPPD
jgi:hypothetical protein